MLSILSQNYGVLLTGTLTTLGVSAAALALGAPIGLILAAVRRGGAGAGRRLAGLYVSFWRGTPILVQLLLVFYLLPLLGVDLPPIGAAIVALAFNTAAFQSEIYRAGLAAIPAGEAEAGRMLGLTGRQILLHIEAPQVVRMMLPALMGEMLALVRNSSLVSVIAVADLTRRTQQIASATFQPLPSYAVALLFYVALAVLFSAFGQWLERRYARQGATS